LELASPKERRFKVFSEGRRIRGKASCRVGGSGGQGEASGADANVTDEVVNLTMVAHFDGIREIAVAGSQNGYLPQQTP
jgi:hypothetical protein